MAPPGTPGFDWLKDEQLNHSFGEHLRATGAMIHRVHQEQALRQPMASDILGLLTTPDKLLGRAVMRGDQLRFGDLRIWALLALLAAASATGAELGELVNLPAPFWKRAHARAAAAEFLVTAIDVLDDVQDGDNVQVQRLGVGRALTAGIALLQLAPLALEYAPAASGSRLLAQEERAILHRGTLGVMVGQNLDAQFEGQSDVSVEQSVEMTAQKSGTLVALVCQLGALGGMEGYSPRQRLYAENVQKWGTQLGTWAQLLNDLVDAEQVGAKSDRARRKGTLPLVLERQGLASHPPGSPSTGWSSSAAFGATFAAAETVRFTAIETLQEIEASFGPHPLLWSLLRAEETSAT